MAAGNVTGQGQISCELKPDYAPLHGQEINTITGKPKNLPLGDESWQVTQTHTPTSTPTRGAAYYAVQAKNESFNLLFNQNNDGGHFPRSSMTSEYYGLVEYTESGTVELKPGHSYQQKGRVRWNLSKICKAFHEPNSLQTGRRESSGSVSLTLPVLFRHHTSEGLKYYLRDFTFTKKAITQSASGCHRRNNPSHNRTYDVTTYEVTGAHKFPSLNLAHRLQEKLNVQPVCGETKESTLTQMHRGPSRTAATATSTTNPSKWSKFCGWFKSICCCLCFWQRQHQD